VINDNSAGNGDGAWHMSASRNGNGQSPALAKMAAREAGRGSGMSGAWSRFLAAHVRWILAVTLAVVPDAAIPV